MIYLDPTPVLLPLRPVTLLVGLRDDTGVALLSDRAAVCDDPTGLYVSDDRTKLLTGESAYVVGMIGKVAAARPNGDLVELDELLRHNLVGAADFDAAVATCARTLRPLADLFCEHVGLGAGQVRPFSQPVYTLLLVACLIDERPAMTAVGLTTSGAVMIRSLDQSVAYAHDAVAVDATAMLLNDRPGTLQERVGRWGDRLNQLAVLAARNGSVLSNSWDHVVLGPDGACGVVRHPEPGVDIPFH